MAQNVSYRMNLPADLDRWIRIEAARGCRSRSGLIVFLLRKEMEAATGGEIGVMTPAAAENPVGVGSASQFQTQQKDC